MIGMVLGFGSELGSKVVQLLVLACELSLAVVWLMRYGFQSRGKECIIHFREILCACACIRSSLINLR